MGYICESVTTSGREQKKGCLSLTSHNLDEEVGGDGPRWTILKVEMNRTKKASGDTYGFKGSLWGAEGL